MMFRGRRPATPRNDGLPVIRLRYDGQAQVRRSVSSRCFWILAILLMLVVLKSSQDEDEYVSNFAPPKQAVSTPKPAPKPAASAPPYKTGPAAAVFPAKCTQEQLGLMERQLPTDRWNERHWRDASFTTATVRSEYAYTPQILREFYASDKFSLDPKHAFFGVSVGWDRNDIPIDMLKIGSRDIEKYDKSKWISLDKKKAQPDIKIAPGKRPARFLVVDLNKDSGITAVKKSFGYNDDELAVRPVTMKVMTKGTMNAFKNIVTNNKPAVGGQVAADQPIHYLDIISVEEQDADILNALDGLLSQVRFLHFQYNKGGSWVSNKLSEMIAQLKHNGLVCYFAGKQESGNSLWRITDCFLKHFEPQHWAGIVCVSAQHDDVKPVAEKMEQKFLDTLQKTEMVYPAGSF